MCRDELKSVLSDVLKDVSGVSLADLNDGLSIREHLNLDSLDLMTLAVEIHDRLGVALEVADVGEELTVGGLIDVLNSKQAAPPSTNRAA